MLKKFLRRLTLGAAALVASVALAVGGAGAAHADDARWTNWIGCSGISNSFKVSITANKPAYLLINFYDTYNRYLGSGSRYGTSLNASAPSGVTVGRAAVAVTGAGAYLTSLRGYC